MASYSIRFFNSVRLPGLPDHFFQPVERFDAFQLGLVPVDWIFRIMSGRVSL